MYPVSVCMVTVREWKPTTPSYLPDLYKWTLRLGAVGLRVRKWRMPWTMKSDRCTPSWTFSKPRRTSEREKRRSNDTTTVCPLVVVGLSPARWVTIYFFGQLGVKWRTKSALLSVGRLPGWSVITTRKLLLFHNPQLSPLIVINPSRPRHTFESSRCAIKRNNDF